MAVSAILVILFVTIEYVSSCDPLDACCLGSASCWGQATSALSGTAYCYGYKACSGIGSTASVEAGVLLCGGAEACNYLSGTGEYASAGTLAYCAGDSACNHAGVFTVGNILHCSGNDACSSMRLSLGDNGEMYCTGYEACSFAKVNPDSSTGRIKSLLCSGVEGCRFAQINSVNKLQAYGSRSLWGATISDTSLIQAYGKKSLLQATVDSDSVNTMNVKLFGFAAGSGANIICRDGATCNIVCKGNACAGLTFSCNPGSTCNISPSACKLDNSVTNVRGIRCPTVDNGVTAQSLDEDYNDDANNNEENGVISKESLTTNCNAANECEGQTISHGNNVFCSGYQGCLNADLSVDDGLLGCGGDAGCKGSKIYLTSPYLDPVTCGGNRGCYQSNITSVNQNIECYGQYGCAESVLIASNDDIECQGKGSCAESVIRGNTILANGEEAARAATIYGASSVDGLGYYSLTYSIIDSDGVTSLNVNVQGNLAGYGATLICRDGSDCTLNCKSTGCKNMDYVCLSGANCNIDPPKCKTGKRKLIDGNDCPRFLRRIPSNNERDYENDEVYQYQQRKVQQDMELFHLLDDNVDIDIIEEFLVSNMENRAEEIELFGDIDIITQQKNTDFMKILFGISSILFIIGSLIYLGYKMKTSDKVSEYQPLLLS
mmetsp:Transcript_35157/g.31007  ORF Transcript_35157/g.31007 Transcript_35157/m.31007 type:complete len:662 (+) Transcript_35157:53-2038(+)